MEANSNKCLINRPSIEQYLLFTGLFIIDGFNEQYKNIQKEELKKIADENYNEMDITVKLGYPFGNTMHYTVGIKNHINQIMIYMLLQKILRWK